ncbi:transmembrane protein 205-like isoform X1 [Zingiber officinale]|uniref:TMEM205-like domain-containing protein n=1 Tax=Zingiber officinale TaxID=94328 RepID=A0A8J5HJ51_ZINOF|nr:transmembrane protein 205-like isoform X1 [Zingiber officinale]KAG6525702.1 hypothetical protein ZIOFF_015668 [Zingiber officinale]
MKKKKKSIALSVVLQGASKSGEPILLPNPPNRPQNPRSRLYRSVEMAWSSRFLMGMAFFALGFVFAPDVFGSGPESPAIAVTAARILHLLAFATDWGAALWVTFIGGIIMFKNLPRHQFGNLQSKMFPAYFTLVSVCSVVSVVAFAYIHPWRSASLIERYQLVFLLCALGFNLSNLIIFTPMTIEMMKQRHKIERDLSIGEEVGWSKNVQVAKTNPQLAAMNRKFGMIHGLSSLANIMAFGSLAIHSWHLAGNIHL